MTTVAERVERLRSLPAPAPAVPARVTALVATYNRCPFGAGAGFAENPLVLSVTTLLTADSEVEVVIVDDGSTDATEAVVGRLRSQWPTRIRVVRTSLHRGSAHARNTALSLARTPVVLLLDDDLVLQPGFLQPAIWQLARLRQQDPRTAALTLPYYGRAASPYATAAGDDFGRLDLDDGYFTTNFDRLPPSDQLDELGLLLPVLTTMVSGFCLFAADALTAIGGFPDLSEWRTSYSDHLLVSAELAERGFQVRHAPDPRLGAIHLKFGAVGRYPARAGADWVTRLGYSFDALIASAAIPRLDTGCRIDDEEFAEEMIGLFFACYAARSRTGGRNWACRVHRDYVDQGTSYTPAYTVVPQRADRAAQWRRGLLRGARQAIADRAQLSDQVLDQVRAACADTGEDLAAVLQQEGR
ncbi:glycosyltransferase family 2 protein [Kribbella sp. NBC_01505]|uniref:glycosyltransferase family 2 protein n=1 Tax=Kribbella sp. NBC_01505 TaxID=2903580 RepID=UPI00386BEEE4